MTTPEDKTPTERIRERTEELKKDEDEEGAERICPFMSNQTQAHLDIPCLGYMCGVWSDDCDRCGLIN